MTKKRKSEGVMAGVVGLIPCAGTASRLNGLPKYLLPAPHGRQCLWEQLVFLLKEHTELVVAALSEPNEALLQLTHQLNFVDHPIVVGPTATMTETVLRALDQLDMDWTGVWLGMPDTSFACPENLMVVQGLTQFDVVVCVWAIQPSQYGQLGQCELAPADATTPLRRVTRHQDKTSSCRFPWAWGMIAWRRAVHHLLRPDDPHVGYLIDHVLAQGGTVGAVVMPGRYFDCGTFEGYRECIIESNKEP